MSRIGKLKFKEGTAKATVAARKAKKAEQKELEEQEDIVLEDKRINFEPVAGIGTITTSGRTVHGNQTRFREQFERGDSIIVEHPVFKTTEERAVTLVLSDKSILLEEPFLEEYSTFVSFTVRKKTQVVPGNNLTQEYRQKLLQLGKSKGIKKDEQEVRLKTGMWGYKTKKVEVSADLSREQLLDVREKMIKDKHCW